MNLHTPLDSGLIHLKTRIAVPPMATQSTERGLPGARTTAYYKAFAENPNVGLVITEHSYVDPSGKADPYQMAFDSDDVIPAQQQLTAAVHQAAPDTKLFAQISHAGASTSPGITGQPLVSASALQTRGGTSRALSVEEIHHLEDAFAAAARRVQAAGYDGVELHSAHGYLLNQFFSPLTNFRDDAYGAQNLDSRLRFLLETVEKVRQAVGPDFPVAVRLGGSDYTEGGSTIADGAAAAKRLEQAGIDLIDLSGGLNFYTRPGHREPGWFSDLSAAVKQEVTIPVLLTGGVTAPAQAETLLDTGAADLIGIGRAMMRNPRWGIEEGE
ncbi:MAG: NADH:flavin oxidoreductase [Pseudoramibacter sp.]